MAHDEQRPTRLELCGEQPSGVGVECQISHRAVTTRQVDGVIVLEANVRQLERAPHLFRRNGMIASSSRAPSAPPAISGRRLIMSTVRMVTPLGVATTTS